MVPKFHIWRILLPVGERHSDAGPPCITPSLNFIQERGTALGKKKFNSEKFDICT